MTRSSCLLCVSACLRLLSTPPSSSVNLALLSSRPGTLAVTTEMSLLPKYETLHLLFMFSGQTPVSRFSLSAPHPWHTRAPPPSISTPASPTYPNQHRPGPGPHISSRAGSPGHNRNIANIYRFMIVSLIHLTSHVIHF